MNKFKERDIIALGEDQFEVLGSVECAENIALATYYILSGDKTIDEFEAEGYELIERPLEYKVINDSYNNFKVFSVDENNKVKEEYSYTKNPNGSTSVHSSSVETKECVTERDYKSEYEKQLVELSKLETLVYVLTDYIKSRGLTSE